MTSCFYKVEDVSIVTGMFEFLPRGVRFSEQEILFDATAKEIRILRHIADDVRELLLGIMVNGLPADMNLAQLRLPETHQQIGYCGFADTAWANDGDFVTMWNIEI